MNTRLAVAIEEAGPDEKVAEHFGRCEEFKILEIGEDKKVIKSESFFNPLTGDHGGACQLPGYLKQFNINAIIAGGMGQRAVVNFKNFNIEVITAPGMIAAQAVEKFIAGELSGYEACKHEHEHHHHHGDSEGCHHN
jgi:predicted Fe-Mo cluster-binding NifX family protein